MDGIPYDENSISIEQTRLGPEDQKYTAYEALNTIYANNDESVNNQVIIDGATYSPNSISVEQWKDSTENAEMYISKDITVPG